MSGKRSVRALITPDMALQKVVKDECHEKLPIPFWGLLAMLPCR